MNPEYDRMLAHARTLPDQAARNREYVRAEHLLVDDAPVILLFHPIAYVMLNPKLHGSTLHALLPSRYADVWLEPEPAPGR